MTEAIQNRYEFVYFFDVENGNPNGDPDAGNMPRIDPETSNGIITDVCLKRKIRNFVELTRSGQSKYNIYIREKAVLSTERGAAYKDSDVTAAKSPADKIEQAKKWMCENYFDVRTFGAVMSTKENNCGQVRGPVQLNFAKSLDPVAQLDVTITRMAVETEKEAEKQQGDNRTMGRKYIVPYGLYRAEGYISANLAEQTGFTGEDLNVLWDALKNMFDHDHSAARGKMSARKLFVFKHASKLGNAPAYKLFDSIKIKSNAADGEPIRSFSQYEITADKAAVPAEVELIEML